MSRTIRIQAKKYPEQLHYEWETTLLQETDQHVIVKGEWGRNLHHHSKGKVFACENVSIEFFPFHEWFTVSLTLVDGVVEGYYCNISLPCEKVGDVVTFVDLDLDYIKDENGWRVADIEEFKENSIRFGYSLDMMRRALHELESLQKRVKSNQFPFDGTLERFVSTHP